MESEKKNKFQIYTDKYFQNPIAKLIAFDKESFIEAMKQIDKYAQSYYLLGYIRYEAKDIFLGKDIHSEYPLLYFEVFETFTTYIPENKKEHIYISPKPCLSYTQYAKAIETIKKQISYGNTYEVNFTYPFNVTYQGDIIALYEMLLPYQKTPYNALIQNKYEEILSFSPELFFIKKGNKIVTKPMKGTAVRKANNDEDLQQIEYLKNSIKNKAENVMIVDLLRNDLSKIALTGTVKVNKLFEIETHKTLHQMTSEIEATLPSDISLYQIFEAIFPCGSITGAPKIKTMEIIHKVEKFSRHVYCGAIGYISPKETIFSVPIRILQRQKGNSDFRYDTGGAIVWDSETNDEWNETLIKTRFLSINNPDFTLIETIKVKNGKLVFGKEHFKRIKQSAKDLGFVYNPEIETIQPTQNGILRIALAKNGTYNVTYSPLDKPLTCQVKLASNPINSKQTLVYHKTSYRPYFESSIKKIQQGELFDEIYFNEKGELTEGARSNIILEINNQWVTPSLECGLLNGIYRQKLLREKRCIEKKLFLSDLQKANNLYCINSVRGITKVILE